VAKKRNETLALLYTRVSTQMQATDGMSLDAQERELIRAAEGAGFTEYEVIREEGRSGKSIKGRPLLTEALERLDTGDAAAIFVTRIDRLARSTRDFLQIVDRAGTHGWRIVMLDLNLDTSTYQGRFVVTVMSALAEMERAIIAERQKDVHKDRRERGKRWGIDLGPQPLAPVDIRDRIVKQRTAGLSYLQIAKQLNADGVPTVAGGEKWHPGTVRKMYLSVLRALDSGLEVD
jgi:DNA invertase Pin-like site-specific DNA recombinase